MRGPESLGLTFGVGKCVTRIGGMGIRESMLAPCIKASIPLILLLCSCSRQPDGAVITGHARDEQAGWTGSDFDDSAWRPARIVAPYGASPWGRVRGVSVTLAPVEADPFAGWCRIPDDVDLTRCRVFLEVDSLEPEAAARVTVNGSYAGGFIGAPLRLDLTG